MRAQKHNEQFFQISALHQVSGVVLDSTGARLSGAVIRLKSARDSMITSSDKEGIFIFENVKMAIFVLTISEIGYQTKISRYLNNDSNSKIVLQPITLLNQAYQLKEVHVKGAPSVVYKIDTVEYRAADYKVPPYATVDELLKKMEGMEVGANGTLLHNGQQVTKAKLNGKLFSGGSVAQAIQNLPANIVDKIQVVDDYGELSARTGIRDGDPSKTLNITTRPDKSIGTMVTIASQEGNKGRYNEQISVQNINANRVLNLIGNISSTVNGIASSNSTNNPSGRGNGSAQTGYSSSSLPGVTKSGSPTFSYTDTWNNNLSITGSYGYNFNNTNSNSENYGQTNSTIGPGNFRNVSIAENDSKNHVAKFELDYNIGKFDFIELNSSYNHNVSDVNSDVVTNNLNYFTTGFEHRVVKLTSMNPSAGYNYGLTGLYVHSFKNPKRNFSVQLGFTHSNDRINGGKNTDYRYYMDTTENLLIKDSLSNLLTFKTSENKIYRSAVTYVEPISSKSVLEFTGQIKNSVFHNVATADTVTANGQLQELTRLENIYNFSFTETRITADYRYGGKNSNVSIGIAIVPTVLSGTQVDNNNNHDISTSRSDFRAIPVFRYSYSWSNVEKFQVMYSGTNITPNFEQIQPFTDRSDPNNIIVGNPNLKSAFTHSLTASYNKYFPNEKFNVSFNINGTLYENRAVSNIVQSTEPISESQNKTVNEITFVNVNGDKAIIGNYAISKQLDDRNYNLTLNGSISYDFNNAVSNSLPYHTTIWDFNERFGPRISLNDNRFLLNPFVGYDVNKSLTNTLNAVPSNIQTFKLALDGQIYLPKNFQLHYDASKNFISGFANYRLNPLVVNTGFQTRFSIHNQSLALTFDVFDLLHQNNFVRQTVTPQSITYTLSNAQSRFFLIGLKLNLQHWGGAPTRNGKAMKRRGDGSFIN